MNTRMMDPERVNPPRLPDPDQVELMVERIRTSGWLGPPIVVLAIKDGFQAITSTSQLEAARQAHLPEIPVVLLDEEEADVCRASAGWNRNGDVPGDLAEVESMLMTAGFDEIARLVGEQDD